MFGLFSIAFFAVFFLAFAMIISTFIRSAKRERSNDRSPRLTVTATVVAKRMQVFHNHSHQSHMHTGHTTYYATFQVASGDRMELPIPPDQYGYLVEGDRGQLTFQGTRFLDFRRS